LPLAHQPKDRKRFLERIMRGFKTYNICGAFDAAL
jgi:hypothetical protein